VLIKHKKGVLMKHTPGPWFDSRSTKSIRITKDSPVFNRGTNFIIAKYPTRTNESLLSHEEWEANAKLIAAAPEMLEVLIECSKHGSLGLVLSTKVKAVIDKATI
jgi:hypothetical protein